MYALNSADGSVKWKTKTGGYINSSPSTDAGGVVYNGSYDTDAYALNSADGSVKW